MLTIKPGDWPRDDTIRFCTKYGIDPNGCTAFTVHEDRVVFTMLHLVDGVPHAPPCRYEVVRPVLP